MIYLLALFTLGIAILAHELGHFAAARLLGFPVPRLMLGYGPKLWRLEVRGTEYAVAALPFGATVEVVGLQSPAASSAWKRAFVHASGPVASFFLAWVLLLGLYWSGTHVPVPKTIGVVTPGSEAARSLLRPGDEIVSVNHQAVRNWSEVIFAISSRVDSETPMTVLRQGRPVEVVVTPSADGTGKGRVGIGEQYVFRRHTFRQSAWLSLALTPRLLREGLRWTAQLLGGKPGPELVRHLSLVKHASQATASGVDSFLRALATVSLLLALFQLLPFPSLDGGRLLFAGLEAAGVPTSARLESVFHRLGFLLLIGVIGWFAVSNVMQIIVHQRGLGTTPSTEIPEGR